MLESIEIINFKAIKSAQVKLTDLSVFVGNNGSGKSSVATLAKMLALRTQFFMTIGAVV